MLVVILSTGNVTRSKSCHIMSKNDEWYNYLSKLDHVLLSSEYVQRMCNDYNHSNALLSPLCFVSLTLASSFVGPILFPLVLFLFIGITTLLVFLCPCIHWWDINMYYWFMWCISFSVVLLFFSSVRTVWRLGLGNSNQRERTVSTHIRY